LRVDQSTLAGWEGEKHKPMKKFMDNLATLFVSLAAKAVREWLERLEVGTLFIEPGSPWENGYVESFFGKMRDELLNGEIFDTLLEARVAIEGWRCEYNQCRPHRSLGYRPPAPEALKPPIFNSQVVQ
jgi:transposase